MADEPQDVPAGEEPEKAGPSPVPPGSARSKPGGKDLAAVILAGGGTAAAAAAEAGCHERTVRRWLELPEYRAKVERLRDEAVGRAMARLSEGMAEAADALRGLVGSRDEHVRHKAARSVIELSLRLQEAITFAQRLKELEERLGAQS